jgi:fructosamine-3-kinase
LSEQSPLYWRIQQTLGSPPIQAHPLSGGMVGDVYRVDLANGRTIVAKVGKTADARLDLEGYMLRYLAQHSRLPVPQVLHSEDTLLLLTFIEGDSFLNAAGQQDAADLLADLHSITQSHYGLERDTLIGPLHQPNPLTASWIDFFREHRLLYMTRLAYDDGPLPEAMRQRIEKLSAHLERWLIEPDYPSLIHGDLWRNNILTQHGRITGFIDPAIYYGHAEIELAYTVLFGGTFGPPFFERYQQRRPIAPGFFEQRRHLYNLYPILVHVRLFGEYYLPAVDASLSRFGF